MDIRRSLSDPEYYTSADVLFVNVPTKWVEPKSGLFDLPFEHLEEASSNFKRLHGDQDNEPNHGLLLIASYLQEQNVELQLIDLQTLYYLNKHGIIDDLPVDHFRKAVAKVRPKVVAFSSLLPALKYANVYIEIARMILDQPVDIIIGGMASVDVSACFKKTSADYVISGEGEYVALDLITSLLNSKSTNAIAGVSCRKDSGGVSVNKRTAPRGQPNVLPAYDLLPRELPLIPRIIASRGCSNRCEFCASAAYFEDKVFPREHNLVMKDVRKLHSNYEFEWFLLGDLTLYTKSGHVKEICRQLSLSDEFKPWWCQTQVSQLDRSSIKMLSAAGCFQVALGFEDFNVDRKSIRQKNPSKEKAKDICLQVVNSGMSVQGYWIFGLPEDTFEYSLQRINDICEFVRAGLVDTVHISFFIPYPETEYFDNHLKYEIEINHLDYEKYLDSGHIFYNDIPMHSTGTISDREIFLFMSLAISSCANEFWKKAANNVHNIKIQPTSFVGG